MEVLYRLSYRGIFCSWGREDSNLRRRSRQIYSLLPLAARAHPPSTPGDPRPETPGYGSKRHRVFNGSPYWSLGRDSNPRPAAYKAAALPLSYPGEITVSHQLPNFSSVPSRPSYSSRRRLWATTLEAVGTQPGSPTLRTTQPDAGSPLASSVSRRKACLRGASGGGAWGYGAWRGARREGRQTRGVWRVRRRGRARCVAGRSLPCRPWRSHPGCRAGAL